MELNDFNERIFRSSADAPSTKAGKLRRMLESAGAKLRWVVIVMPVGALLMIPILCGMFIDQRILIGGIRLQWFGVWLELLWISLWAGLVSSVEESIALLTDGYPRLLPKLRRTSPAQLPVLLRTTIANGRKWVSVSKSRQRSFSGLSASNYRLLGIGISSRLLPILGAQHGAGQLTRSCCQS